MADEESRSKNKSSKKFRKKNVCASKMVLLSYIIYILSLELWQENLSWRKTVAIRVVLKVRNAPLCKNIDTSRRERKGCADSEV